MFFCLFDEVSVVVILTPVCCQTMKVIESSRVDISGITAHAACFVNLLLRGCTSVMQLAAKACRFSS